MEVILISDVRNLGGVGDLVSVKPGYARNFLLPRKLAIVASVNSKKRFEHEKRVATHRLSQLRASDQALAKKIGALDLRIGRKVGDSNKLFGSVTTHDIEHALAKEGLEIGRRQIELVEPIKALGTFAVQVKLRADLKTELKVSVVAE